MPIGFLGVACARPSERSVSGRVAARAPEHDPARLAYGYRVSFHLVHSCKKLIYLFALALVAAHCWCAAPWPFFRRSISVLCSSFSVPISFRGARRRSDRRAETCTFYPHVKPRSFSPT